MLVLLLKMIVSRNHLGKRININTWREQYKADKGVCERIDDFLTRYTYAMRVLSFQMTKEIELERLLKSNPNFVCPQIYYYLDNYPELFEFIKKNATDIGELRINSFVNIGKDEICRKKY